jgi:2-phosphosulfolactate phosphatase
MTARSESDARFFAAWEVAEFTGPVIAIDVLRAFTTSAYAFASGASAIYLVASVAEALEHKARHPGVLAMGEDGGLRPDGFDFSNSPVAVAEADLRGRTLVQRTSAGTRGALAARSASRVWCASLVCASATARAVLASGLGAPGYVITGRFEDRPDLGQDDLAVALFIEQARQGLALDPERVAREVEQSDEARRTLALGAGHVHPDDIAYATRVDAFDFALELRQDSHGFRLVAVGAGA